MKSQSLTIQDHTFEWGRRTYVMGILNITPDSFSGDGVLDPARSDRSNPTALIKGQAGDFLEAGVDLLDVGAESTRPGADPVGVEEELDRLIPVVEALAAEFDTVISVDTYKARVAEAALKAGAHIINDVWGLRADPEIAHVAARYQAPVILMHNRLKPASAEVRERLGGHYVGVAYQDLIADIKRELMGSVELAHVAGIPDGCIILDPGIGFGKTISQNLELLNRLNQFQELGYPLLVGPSRKSFIGYTLDLPPDERMEGTAAAVAVAIDRGADIVRVHDAKEIVRVVRMTDAIVREA